MAQRGPYAKGIAKREEILQTALELFAVRGYDRVSVREIARECGLSQAGLLHHFSGKEELFLEVLRRRDSRNGDLRDVEQTYSVDRLIAAVERNIGEPGLVRLYVTMSAEGAHSDGPTRQFFQERYAGLNERVATDVRVQQESGGIPADLDADDVAILLIAAADGLQLQWLLDPATTDMGALITELWVTIQRLAGGDPDRRQARRTTMPAPGSATSRAATIR